MDEIRGDSSQVHSRSRKRRIFMLCLLLGIVGGLIWFILVAVWYFKRVEPPPPEMPLPMGVLSRPRPDKGEQRTMSERASVSNSMYCFLPTEVEGFGPLAELALDMRWSWNHYADDVWRQLDPALWELTQNPWVVLQTVSRDKLRHRLADPGFRQEVDALVQSQA